MDETIQTQVETYLTHLNGLIRRGRELGEALATDPADPAAIAAARRWHEDCGVTINQLSGGSKAHWLARSFSEAFLMRSTDGHAVEGAAQTQIVQRLLGVLDLAVATLSQMDDASLTSASSQAPTPHRFDFVHDLELRPVVERAYTDSRRALEQKEYHLALLTSCGILEAIVTDALEHRGLSSLVESGAPAEKISDWSFETRLTVAERVGLIRSGCARLPAIARAYRDSTVENDGIGVKTEVTERDARTAGQVLHVVMRDLDPGR
ncbi:MAG: hypothetical protein WAU50_18525 [Candidatus Sulfotelmatobacter sp.]